MVTRVHNERKEGEYPNLTIPSTNALHKVCAVNHPVLSFCINTFRVTKDLMIGVNSFVVLCIQISILYRSSREVLPVRNTRLNSMAGHSRPHCWLEGFLDCSLCCSAPLFWAESWEFSLGILELTEGYAEFMHS